MTIASKTAASRLPDVVGAEHVSSNAADLSAYAIDGKLPSAIVRPGSTEEVIEIVKYAAAEKLALIASGARTKLGIGLPPARYDLALDMTRLNRIIAYDPGDLTLSVEAAFRSEKWPRRSPSIVNFCRWQSHFSIAPPWEAQSPPASIPRCGSFTARRGIMFSGWNLFWEKECARKAAATW